MTRIQMACYSLIASAFILSGLLLVQLQARQTPLLPTAHAEMVLARDNFTMMTARTREAEEALFVIENSSQRLLVYKLDMAKRRLELAGGADLGLLFRAGDIRTGRDPGAR